VKLKNITNIEGLFDVIDRCEGKVELVGDDLRLNLKSKLSQYFSLAKLFSDGEIPEMEIITYNQEDTNKLIRFMMSGNANE
jgi:hypothetical protein